MDSYYDYGMYWDSREGLDGMHVLDARGTSELGNGTDTRMMAEIRKLEQNDVQQVGSAIVSVVKREVA